MKTWRTRAKISVSGKGVQSVECTVEMTEEGDKPTWTEVVEEINKLLQTLKDMHMPQLVEAKEEATE